MTEEDSGIQQKLRQKPCLVISLSENNTIKQNYQSIL